MMNRRHLKDLLVSDLDAADLNDVGHRLNDIDDSDGKDNQRTVNRICQRRNKTAEEIRTGVAHHNLCRVMVPDKIPRKTAGKSRTDNSDGRRFINHRHDNEAYTDGKCYSGAKSVQTVREVDGIDRSVNGARSEEIIENKTRHGVKADSSDKRNNHRGASRNRKRSKIAGDNQKLRNRFLNFGQSEVTLFDDLDVVVGKADHCRADGKKKTRNKLYDFNASDVFVLGKDRNRKRLAQKCGNDNRNGDSDNKHQSAHGRRTLLFCVPARSDICKYILTELQLMKLRNQNTSENRRKHKSNHSRNQSSSQ